MWCHRHTDYGRRRRQGWGRRGGLLPEDGPVAIPTWSPCACVQHFVSRHLSWRSKCRRRSRWIRRSLEGGGDGLRATAVVEAWEECSGCSIRSIVVSIFMHQEVDRGKAYHPMLTMPHYHPTFAPPALQQDWHCASPARPTSKSRLPNKVQDNELSGDASSSLWFNLPGQRRRARWLISKKKSPFFSTWGGWSWPAVGCGGVGLAGMR